MTQGVGKLWGLLAPVIVVQVSGFLLLHCDCGNIPLDDPDQDQWSEITQILTHQRNQQIPPWERIYWFISGTMIQVILDY